VAKRRLWFGKRLGLWVSHKTTIRGVTVAFTLMDREDRSICVNKIEAAFDLIAKYQPYRLARIARDVRRIWVWGHGEFSGQWIDELGMCQLAEDYLLQDSVDARRVAATILHEATHARLCSSGIRYEERLRGRIERLCARAEIDFAERLPDGEQLIAWADEKRSWDTAEWSNAALFRRKIDAVKRLIAQEDFPRWLQRPVDWLIRRRMKRTSAKAGSGPEDMT
jgi:hypothetical protein